MNDTTEPTADDGRRQAAEMNALIRSKAGYGTAEETPDDTAESNDVDFDGGARSAAATSDPSADINRALRRAAGYQR